LKVTLDVFSGRPNPSWQLSEADKKALLDRFAGRAMPSVAEVETVLGYRGYIVSAREDSARQRAGLPPEFRVRSGVPQAALAPELEEVRARPRERDDDALWLLSTARDAIDDDLAAYVEESIRAAPARPEPPPAPDQPAAATRADTRAQEYITASCIIRNSPFIPVFWDQPGVMPYNNCYNYAMNYRSNSFAQPGRISGRVFTNISCEQVSAAAHRDGCVRDCAGVAQEVALVIWPNVDFHWYRNQTNGFWGHKIGPTPATNVDDLDRLITDALSPELCARGPYTQFCGFLHPPLWIPVL